MPAIPRQWGSSHAPIYCRHLNRQCSLLRTAERSDERIRGDAGTSIVTALSLEGALRCLRDAVESNHSIHNPLVAANGPNPLARLHLAPTEADRALPFALEARMRHAGPPVIGQPLQFSAAIHQGLGDASRAAHAARIAGAARAAEIVYRAIGIVRLREDLERS